jgi:hypothetical protein
MFRHRGAILRDLLQQRFTSQPANICFNHSHKHNLNVSLLKYIKFLEHLKQILVIFYSVLMCYLLTYLLTTWSRVLLEKLTGLQLVKKFPAFYGTRKFLTTLTSARHLSLSWASPIQSSHPHPTSWRSILTLSSHLRLGLPSGLFPPGFTTRTLYTPLPSPIRATRPAHLILLDFITRKRLGKEYRPFSSSLCNFLHSSVTSSLLGPSSTYCTHIFKIIFSTFSFQGSINRRSCSQNVVFIQISHFSCSYIEWNT